MYTMLLQVPLDVSGSVAVLLVLSGGGRCWVGLWLAWGDVWGGAMRIVSLSGCTWVDSGVRESKHIVIVRVCRGAGWEAEQIWLGSA
jgi:hypothetical protein